MSVLFLNLTAVSTAPPRHCALGGVRHSAQRKEPQIFYWGETSVVKGAGLCHHNQVVPAKMQRRRWGEPRRSIPGQWWVQRHVHTCRVPMAAGAKRRAGGQRREKGMEAGLRMLASFSEMSDMARCDMLAELGWPCGEWTVRAKTQSSKPGTGVQ